MLLLGLPLFDALLARVCAQEQNQPNLQKSPSSLYLAPVSPACDAQSSQPTDRPCHHLCSLRPLTWDPTALSLSLAHLYLSFSLLSSLVDTSSLSTLRLAPLLTPPHPSTHSKALAVAYSTSRLGPLIGRDQPLVLNPLGSLHLSCIG